jgi:hypothetical protein
MAERVLVLGTAGVRKSVALKNLNRYQIEQSGTPNFVPFDLERTILDANRIPFYRYLDADEERQCTYWLKGWKALKYKEKNKYL